jgi:RimJ/RimL family protein N-acetyltransferase
MSSKENVMQDLFRGELVRFTAEDPATVAKSEVQWQRDSEFVRLADYRPARVLSRNRLQTRNEERMEKGPQPERYTFSIRALADDQLIGFLSLSVDLIHSDAWVGLGIGERDFWSKGYGTDMMKICLRYAFMELGVRRVTLGLHAYNTRALRSYEKSGFRLEGRTRHDVFREGQHSDTIWMGILREEWLQMQKGDPA